MSLSETIMKIIKSLLLLLGLGLGFTALAAELTTQELTALIAQKQSQMLKYLEQEPTAKIEWVSRNDRKYLSIDGKLQYPWLIAIPGSTLVPNAQSYIKAYHQAGFELVKINIRSAHFVKGCYWNQTQDDLQFDFDNPDLPVEAAQAGDVSGFLSVTKKILAVLHANPDAYLLLSLDLSNSPRWWRRTHPDDFVRFANGTQLVFPQYKIAWYDTQPSLSSVIWLDYACRTTAAFVQFIQNSPMSKRVLGYYLTYGESYERFWPGWTNGTIDFAAPTESDFGRFSGGIYGDQPVPPDAMRKAGQGEFTVGPDAQHCLKFYRYLADKNQDILELLAAAAKKSMAGNQMLGTAGLYYLAHTNRMYQQSAHPGAFERLLQNKDIDFISATYSFCDRGIGGITSSSHAAESILLHHKLSMTEEDLITPAYKTKVQHMMEDITDWDGCIEALTRDAVASFVRGQGLWWLDLGGDRRYIHPPLITRAKELKTLFDRLPDTPSEPNAEIAVIVDPEACYHLTADSPLLRCLQLFQLTEINRIGAGFDCYYVGDLAQIPAKYKMYLFLGTFQLSVENCREIARLKTNSATILWLYGAGILDQSHTLSASSVTALTDQSVELDLTKQPLRGKITGKLCSEINSNDIYGGGDRPLSWMEKKRLEPPFPYPECAPAIHCTDPQAKLLAQYISSPGSCLSVKKLSCYTSVVATTYTVPASLLRYLAGEAGVHLYAGLDDFVVSRGDLVMVSFARPGQNTVVFPANWSRCRELFTNREVNLKDHSAVFDTPYGSRVILLKKTE